MLWQVNLSVTSRQIRSGQYSDRNPRFRDIVQDLWSWNPRCSCQAPAGYMCQSHRISPLSNSATSCQAASRSLPATVCMLLPVCQVENHHCPSFVGMFIIAHVTEVQANASWQVVHTRCPKLKRENRPGTSASLSSPILQHGCRE